MILGDICTRSCRFCDVTTGRPQPPDPEEPRRVAELLSRLGLEHTVITCVDRDDLADFGAAHWAETIRRVKASCPTMTLEVLAGDFKGQTDLVDLVLDADPDVFAHNLETVPRLSRQVRVQASYPRSYKILEHARARGAVTKTGLMLGLGETTDEIQAVLRELAGLGVDIVTLGQYLSPSKDHLPIERYVEPAEFVELEQFARAAGITHVVAGPLVRSSYHADGQAQLVRELRAGKQVAG
jgi:lipoic acid synthetase